MVLAEFGVGQVLWSFFWIFLFLLFISLVFSIFGDIIRSVDLSGWAKAGWTLVILALPFLGVLLYLVVRGGSMNERMPARHAAIHDQYRPTTGGGRR